MMLSELARTEDPVSVIENIAYSAVDRDGAYEEIPEVGRRSTTHVYDPVRGRQTPTITASYEKIDSFRSSPPDGSKLDTVNKPK